SAQVISFDSSNVVGPNFAYVVTDDQGTILGLPPGDQVNFGPAGPGVCWVWGLSYSGNVTAMVGDNALSVALSDGCFDLSDDFLVVVRDSVSGGSTVTDENGADSVFVCIDGSAQFVSFDSVGPVGPNFAYVVTDDQGVILGLPPGDMVNFGPAGTGICYVWGLSYTGAVTAMVGDNALQVALSDGCFDLSDNFLVVVRDSLSGGIVSADSGDDTVFVCLDGNPQVVAFDSSATCGPNFNYVVTDNQGTILGLPPADMVNFAPAGTGECWVWGLSYTGNLTAMVGQNAFNISFSDGNFDLSDEFVVVFRDSVSGGMVSASDGSDSVFVCIDGNPQVVSFDSINAVGPNFAYVITDDQGTILGLPPGDMANFGPAGPGVCYVWGLSYSGTVTAQQGDNALQVELASGCFDLSDNFLVVVRDSVSGGLITDENGADSVRVCIDGMDQVISFDSTEVFGENFAYVITDDQGTILGLPPGDQANFGPAGPGICYVWGLSYTGNVTAMVGDNALQIDLSDGCFDLSDNFLVVIRDSVNGGSTVTSPDAVSDTVFVCIDGTDQLVSFDSADVFGENFAYVITDDQGTILGLPPGDQANFGPAGVGVCYVWGLSYTGSVTAQVGDNAMAVDLSDGCFDLSDEFLVVYRDSAFCATNIDDELPLGTISIFPNPVKDQLNIRFDLSGVQFDNADLRIFDLTGREIYRENIVAAAGEHHIATGNLQSGLYIVEVRTTEGVFRSRLLKE
ncbi:MAG: T9SS type A sorting domain-containing protein, partial [Bacteroidota bacterium]